MIIVGQGKNEIINFDNVMNIEITNCDENDFGIFAGFIVGRDDNYRLLGYYSTERRAKEVLQEIINEYQEYVEIKNNCYGVRQVTTIPKIYKMPKE